jgi:hypothetical protein
MTLQTTVVDDDQRGVALLKAIGLDKLPVEQRELAISIANKYDLDLLLKHLVLIDGRAYITRDGLLHVAHKSGQFDGIETTDPVLIAGYWRSTCSVYRKDMGRPFTYTGRYPEAGRNKAYAPEMAVKVGEVMALRRAFDVAAPSVEERWSEDHEPVDEPEKPASLTDLVEQRAAAIETNTTSGDHVVITSVTYPAPADVRPVVVPGTFAGVEPVETAPAPENLTEPPVPSAADVSVESAPGLTLEAFLTEVVGYKRDEVRAVTKSMYPDAKKASDLNDAQRLALVEQIKSDLQPTVAAVVEADRLCEVRSPMTQAPCDKEEGHSGRHLDAPGSEAW